MSDASKHFLADFFAADGNHPDGDGALQLFRAAFVPPLKLDDLATTVNFDTGRRKVVIIDGHPRSGKTWSAVHVISDLIDRGGLSPSDYWTSGSDSLKVAPSDETSLLDSLRRVAEVLAAMGMPRLVFLDDLLGTNRIRPLGDIVESREEISRYFRWNSDNPLLETMAEESILVMTGRSLHVTAIELLFGIDLRTSADRQHVKVLNPRRGLFVTSRKGDPFGTFNRALLAEVSLKNRKSHPFSGPEDVDWFVMAVPLVAFNEEPRISEAQKKLAASVLFEDDLDCLAALIKLVERPPTTGDVPGWLPAVLASLRCAYLVMIAPGLVFLDPAAYQALGMEDDERSFALARSLYLYESDGDFCSGRLPNEMYMLALDSHLRRSLEAAAETFVAIVSAKSTGNAPSLGLRGFIERALHAGGREGLAALLVVPNFASYSQAHQRDAKDPFMRLELSQSLPPGEAIGARSAGFVTAIGWSLYNFSSVYGLALVREALETWFPTFFRQCFENVPDATSSQFSEAVVTYSTFLQWALKICDKHQEHDEAPDWVEAIIGLRKHGSVEMQRQLEMILEDEITWAVNERYHLASSARTFIDSREMALRQAPSDTGVYDDELDSNRFFSLAWHNEWMTIEEGSSERTQVIRQWMDSQRERLRGLIVERPGLIDNNLSYHWTHFVTQRAVWMRDWCFSDNPLEFERKYSQICSGSIDPSHNDDIESIALAVLAQGCANSVRTVVLLVGTRAARMPRFDLFTNAVRDRLKRDSRPDTPALRTALLHAVFELARQGFFDPLSEDTTPEFRTLCLDLLRQLTDLLPAAWSSYRQSLQWHTHYDVLPREHDGWKDVEAALQPKEQQR